MLGDAQAVENNALQVSPSLTRRSHWRQRPSLRDACRCAQSKGGRMDRPRKWEEVLGTLVI